MSKLKLFAMLCCWVSAQAVAAVPAAYDEWTVLEGPYSAPVAGEGQSSDGLQQMPSNPEPVLHAGTIVTDGSTPSSYRSPGGCSNYPTASLSFLSSHYSRGPYVFMPDPIMGSVIAYDFKNGVPTSRSAIATGQTPYGVVISKDGRYAYVSNRGEGSVSVIDILKSAVVKTYVVGNDPAGVAFNADQSELYVANEADGTVTVIDIGSGATLATIPVGIAPHMVSSLKGVLYVLDRQHADLAIVAADRHVDAVIHLADGAYGLARDMVFNPTGTTLYVTLQDSAAVKTALVVVDIANRSVQRKLAMNGLPKGLGIDYYGTHLYVATDAPAWTCARLYDVAVDDFSTISSVELDHGVDGLLMRAGDIYILNSAIGELIPIAAADFSVRQRPFALHPGAAVLGYFYGGSIELAVQFDPPRADFGTATADQIVKKTLTVTNNDVVSFTITGLTIKGPGYANSTGATEFLTANFLITENLCFNTILDPGEHCTIEIAFVPNPSGSDIAKLEYFTNPDSNYGFMPPYVTLTGNRTQTAAVLPPEDAPASNADLESGLQAGGGAIHGGEVLGLLLISIGVARSRSRTVVAPQRVGRY